MKTFKTHLTRTRKASSPNIASSDQRMSLNSEDSSVLGLCHPCLVASSLMIARRLLQLQATSRHITVTKGRIKRGSGKGTFVLPAFGGKPFVEVQPDSFPGIRSQKQATSTLWHQSLTFALDHVWSNPGQMGTLRPETNLPALSQE